jgi:tetratricopeptide (TPR) repeat protein
MADLLKSLRSALADRYQIDRELGRGGMAVVFIAQDLKHHRPVAIKVLRPELAQALGPERFLREIDIAARLTHPHILPLLDSGEAGGFLYYVMPYVEGESLRDRLSREQQLPVAGAVDIARQVASALAYAHGHNIVHRDIKPENILLAGDEVVVADFGIARAITAAGGEQLTSTGIAVGTPPYMSPEQGAGEPHLDGRSDLYSLGCVLYEMLAGAPPFAGPTAQAIQARRLTDPVPPLRTVRETVPINIEQAIEKALAKVPGDRFATAEQFADALTQLPRPPSPVMERRPGGEVPSRRSLVIGVAAIALALGVWATVRWSRSPTAQLDPNLIAVAPFEVLHPKLDLWREGLVDVLSRDMDGAGILRTVPLTVVLQHWRGRADPAAATELGRRTGARLALFGTVAPEGPDSVRLRATVVDVGSGRKLFEMERLDHADRIDRLGDSVTVDVLRALGRTSSGGRIRLASVGTKSLPALKSFLRGEQLFRRFSLDSAIAEFERALEFDSAYALALNRLGTAHDWIGRAGLSSFYLKAGRFNHGLAPRDSLFITADSLWAAAVDTLNHAYWTDHLRMFTILEEAVRRYPDDPEAWYRLGEARYHGGYRVGSTGSQVREAFDRAIALDSAFAPAYVHPVELTLYTNDTTRARRYVTGYLSLASGVDEGEGIRIVAMLIDHRPAQSSELQTLLDTASANTLALAAMAAWGWPDSTEMAVRFFRYLAAGRPGAGGYADTGWANRRLQQFLSFRGHLHESYALIGNRVGAPFADLAVAGGIPVDTAAAVFQNWLRSPGEDDFAPEPPVFYCDRILGAALWWASRRDTASLLALLSKNSLPVRIAPSVPAVQKSRSRYGLAQAALALARRDTATALHRFLAFPDSMCPSASSSPPTMLRLIRFRLLASAGRDREAIELFDPSDVLNVPWATRVLGILEAGRVAERLGDREGALRRYQFVADVWRNADPELQPYVAEARAGLRRLSREPRPQ